MGGGATRFFMLLTTNTTPSPILRHHHGCSSLLRLSRHRNRHLHRVPASFPAVSRYSSSASSLPLLSPTASAPTFPIKNPHRQLHTQTVSAHLADSSSPSSSSPPPLVSQPWPEWSNFLNSLSAAGYFNQQGIGNEKTDDFVSSAVDLPGDFRCAAAACLAFAGDRPNLLRMLSMRDIEVVVENGTPFLFRNGDDSVRRMRSFLSRGDGNAFDADKACMIDLMRYLLSYASNLFVSVGENNPFNREIVETSVQNLLSELARLSYSAPELNLPGSAQNQFPDRYGQTARPLGRNIEMKRGDWICPRCSFMNFARNMKCLECEELRPKRQLTGGEWECPQCDFFNYGRNTVCLRCDCKRPGEISLGAINSSKSGLEYGNRNRADKVDVDSRLAANEEKAQRWFSKVSQLDGSSDMSSAIADEDFPEIMPLRKGVNRFVVSTRKTPLERRLANAQYRRNLGNDGIPEGNEQSEDAKVLDQGAIRSLDEIIGHTSGSESNNNSVSTGQNVGTNSPPSFSSSPSPQHGPPRGSSSNHVSFVPLPADMFAKKPENSNVDERGRVDADNDNYFASSASEQTGPVLGSNESAKPRDNWQLSEKSLNQTESGSREKEQAEKSERWFKRVAELHDVTDIANEISDKDFPEIMPLRTGENRFVVNKKKDRSLTSPMYKRRSAMEQANSTNYVPFVPFPPDYFAKKDKQQPEGADTTNKTSETSNLGMVEKPSEKLNDARPGFPCRDHAQGIENQQVNMNRSNSTPNANENNIGAAYRAPSESSTPNLVNPQNNGKDSWSSGYPRKESTIETSNTMTGSSQPSEDQNIRNSWTGKSLEGSAVKEPDPLDMSEEAKAERWFRRVAQIKDISELSQIPDEDFPSIMPMRKGVNRFVVSKRKTPLERRLTSTQYRRNLPIVSSDPTKKETDSS